VADRRGKRDFSERIQGINGYYVDGERQRAALVGLAKTGREINVCRALGISFSPETPPRMRAAGSQRCG